MGNHHMEHQHYTENSCPSFSLCPVGYIIVSVQRALNPRERKQVGRQSCSKRVRPANLDGAVLSAAGGEIRLTARLMNSLCQPKFGFPAILSPKLIWSLHSHTVLLVKLDLGPQSLKKVQRVRPPAGIVADCAGVRSKVLPYCGLRHRRTPQYRVGWVDQILSCNTSVIPKVIAGTEASLAAMNFGEEDFSSHPSH